jgi:hypothetical protein
MTVRYFPQYGYSAPPRRQGGMVGVGGVSNWWGSASPKANTFATPKAYIRIGTDSFTSTGGHGQVDYPFLRFQSIALENHSAGMALIGDDEATNGWYSSLRVFGGSQTQTNDYRLLTYMTEYDAHPSRPGLSYVSTGVWDHTHASGNMAEAATQWTKQDSGLGYIQHHALNHFWYNNPQYGVTAEQMFTVYGGTTRTVQVGSSAQSYNLSVLGTLSKSSGTFDIEHPTVEGKRLRHSFIEGPQADLIYRGTAELGAAPMVIDMDTEFNMTAGTWEALNCTPWSMVSASGKIVEWVFEGSTLTITGDEGTTCMWMVIGERHDPHMKSPACEMADGDGHLLVEYDAPELLPQAEPVDIL